MIFKIFPWYKDESQGKFYSKYCFLKCSKKGNYFVQSKLSYMILIKTWGSRKQFLEREMDIRGRILFQIFFPNFFCWDVISIIENITTLLGERNLTKPYTIWRWRWMKGRTPFNWRQSSLKSIRMSFNI